jgi:hypothetical protein
MELEGWIQVSVSYAGKPRKHLRLYIPEALVPRVGEHFNVHKPQMRGKVIGVEWVYEGTHSPESVKQRPVLVYVRLWPASEV